MVSLMDITFLFIIRIFIFILIVNYLKRCIKRYLYQTYNRNGEIKITCSICDTCVDSLAVHCDKCKTEVCMDCIINYNKITYESNGHSAPSCMVCHELLPENKWYGLTHIRENTQLNHPPKKTRYSLKVRFSTTGCPWCGARVSRSGGCNHITCLCGKEFCFKCGQKWNNGKCMSFTCKKPLQRVLNIFK